MTQRIVADAATGDGDEWFHLPSHSHHNLWVFDKEAK
jgi:hypothetical protein